MLYTIEDEPRMMKIHDKAMINEGIAIGREKTRAEDLKNAINYYMKTGLSEEEATQLAKEVLKISFKEQ